MGETSATHRSPHDEFGTFLRAVEPRLASYLRYATKGTSDADDVFQEVCLAAHRAWPRVRGLERPSAWAVKVARNLLVNRAKRRAIELRALPRASEGAAPPADRPVREGEVRAAVAAALAGLPDDEREAVCLKIWGELTWREIGETLGVSDDAAARLCARALRTLAPRLREFEP